MRLSSLLIIGIALVPVPSFAQGQNPGVSPPPAVESAPLPPPPASPAELPAAAPPPQPAPVPPPVATPAPAPAAPPAIAPAPTTAGRPTLVPNPGDPVNVDDVTLPAKPTAILSGMSTWDEGFNSLKNAFRTIEEELTRAGIAPAGRPLTVFLQTDDLGFRYEAMIPIPPLTDGRTSLTPAIRFGTTPSGKALRFVHKAPYDEIDETYETMTAYLDAKSVTVKDAFIEEYVTDLTEPGDANLEINVFVQPQ
jgi:effector-binding domain-containing protein